MFLHASILHIGFNMYALWVIGTPVEQYLGRARFVGLYFVSGLAGSAGGLLQAPHSPILGASGAIFGILGAMLIIEYQVTGRLAGNALTFIVINLVISFAIPNISWGGHVGGLIGGILIMLAYAHWTDRGRAQYGQLGLGGVRRLDRRRGRQHRARVLEGARLRVVAASRRPERTRRGAPLSALPAPPQDARAERGTASSSRSRARCGGRTPPTDGSPPCSPQMPSLMSGLVSLPRSTPIRIRSPTPSVSSTSNGFRSRTPSSR